jgi:hypothetical protein
VWYSSDYIGTTDGIGSELDIDWQGRQTGVSVVVVGVKYEVEVRYFDLET